MFALSFKMKNRLEMIVTNSLISSRSETNSSLVTNLNSLFQIVGASLLIALFSQIKIALPFSPVPLSLQTFGVLLVGASLGSKKGAAAMLLYLVQVVCGLPVLSSGGANALALFGPTGGYLMGFVMEAYCIGWFVERMPSYQPLKLLLASFLACSLQLGFGAMQLASFVGWDSVMLMGIYPFILGEILKSLAVCAYMKSRMNQA